MATMRGSLKMSIPSVEEVMKGETTVLLATMDGDQPRVRPVTSIENNGELFVLTGSEDAKIRQIQQNAKVEVVALVPYADTSGYIRFSARAKIINDPKIRERVADTTSFFSNYFKSSSDPKYALIHLIPERIEYLKPGEMYPESIAKFDFTK
jgi:general stress protein 26